MKKISRKNVFNAQKELKVLKDVTRHRYDELYYDHCRLAEALGYKKEYGRDTYVRPRRWWQIFRKKDRSML